MTKHVLLNLNDEEEQGGGQDEDRRDCDDDSTSDRSTHTELDTVGQRFAPNVISHEAIGGKRINST